MAEKSEKSINEYSSLHSSFQAWGDIRDDPSGTLREVGKDRKQVKLCCKNCCKKKKNWEPLPQTKVFKSNEVANSKGPSAYTILDYKFWDVIFVASCLASIFLFTFCEGFLITSRLLWGIIHSVNALYSVLLLLQWTKIILRLKFSQNCFTKMDVVFSLLSVLPIDLVVLLVYSLDDNEDPEQKNNQENHIAFTLSRIHYTFRIKHILNYLAGWENQLILGDFYSFLLRILLYSTLILHTFACIWHRVACNSFRPKHFLMDPFKAREDICDPESWIMRLSRKRQIQNQTYFTPFLQSTGYSSAILWDHYAASLYWSTATAFRLGYGDFETNLVSIPELVTQSLAQIVSWIFVLAVVSGTLTSLLIESDTERESYLTRRFAINHYLGFSKVSQSVVSEVKKFYDYLWAKRKGVSELNLVEFMPAALKAEIFFDIHKFVLEQMPLFQDLDPSFLMTLSVHMTHSFHLTGETLFRRNDRGNHMYYVLKGHLEILSADESHPIACIKSGSAIGEIFLVHPYSHACTVRCGSECDILALTRDSVNDILRDYPQYSDVLQSRIQERFEQSVLLLGLAKKYNEAGKYFAKLPYEMPMPDVLSAERDKEEELKALRDVSDGKDVPDADGLSLTSSAYNKLASLVQNAKANKEKKIDKRRRNIQDEAYAAFATDVNRTTMLAKDLGIGRVPLIIATPGTSVNVKKDSAHNVVKGESQTFISKLKHMPIVSGEESSNFYLGWKFFVSLCGCIAVFYYPYQLAFRATNPRVNLKYDGIMHLTDLIFGVDCFFDMLQIVVTPQKTLETVGDIMSFRLRSFSFYGRVFAFLPLEYILAPMLEIDYGASPYYYVLKFNRFLEMMVVTRFFQDLEGCTRIPIMLVFLSKFLLVIFYVTHIFAVSYEYVLRDYIPNILMRNTSHLDQENEGNYHYYAFVLYWSAEVVTTAGFGDIPYLYGVEVFVMCMAFITGTVATTFLGAKLAAILANAQRRRIGFKQTYYGVTAFLNQRKFPADLAQRIKSYYKMQWKAHEGVLIPKERSAIWDAPEAIISEVTLSQALKYISRVPLVKFTSENVLRNMCSSLKQYFVPPDECVLFEGDKRRELYIVVKGYCNVYRGNEFIGHLSEGNYFGLSGLIMGVNLNYRITSETHCLFFCLQFDDFVEIAKKHKFLRKDYRLLRGETPFETLQTLISEPQMEDGSNPSKILEKELEHIASETHTKRKSAGMTCLRAVLRCFLLRRTFSPSGKFITCWVVLRVIAATLISLYVVAQISFNFDPQASFIVVLVFDIIAWVDIYLMLHVSYHNENNQLVNDPLKTAENYICGAFLMDLIFSFPFELIVIVSFPAITIFTRKYHYANKYRIIAALRLNRFFQFYKLIQLGNILNETICTSLTFITLLEVMPWMLVALHILACISVALVCRVTPNGEAFTCSNDAWLTHGSLYEPYNNVVDMSDPFRMYIIAFYWTIVTALRVGFGDIDSITTENRLIAVFVILSGTLFTTYLSSKLTACMVGEDSRRIEIREKIDIMYAFLDRYKASRAVKRRVKEIYYNEWDKTKGISADQLFEALHPSLKADVMSHLYEERLRQSPLLSTLDEPGIRMLSSILKEEFLVEGEYIFKYGNITDDVYLISSGIVAAYNVKGDVMSYMGTGSLIGEMSALYGVTRLYTAVAATDVDILLFKAEDFLDFLELYPALKEQLEELCESMDQGPDKIIARPVDDLNPVDPFTRMNQNIEVSSPKERVKRYAVRGLPPTDNANMKMQPIVQYHRNPMCILDPLRVPLKHGQLGDTEKELMLQDSGSDRKWWSVFVTFGRVPKTEMGALLHIFQDKKRCTILNFTVHPASPIIRSSGWCVFNLLITAISCALTAYEISFSSFDEGESWPISVLRYCAEMFFVTRIIGNFHLGYNDDAGVLITDVKKISKKYCLRFDGFVLDFITTFPFYAFSYIAGGPGRVINAANIRGIQLLRVVLFVRYLGETTNDLRMKASEVKILKITILLCFIFHFCACAWYLGACYGLVCLSDSWMAVLLNRLLGQDSISSEADITIAHRYWMSLTYVTTTITATGYNYITPRTTKELVITICFIFGTVFVIGYLLGEMTQCLASQISRKIHYEHELSVVQTHLAGLGLNKTKRDIVADYYKLVWRRFRGMPYFSLLQELPFPLRADIAYEIYESNVKNAKVLGSIDEQVLRQITARIRHEFYLPGGHIVRGGNVCDAMYFIKHGEILIVDENMGIELCVETLYENDCFGEIKILLPREAYRFSYVARVESEVGMLKRDDLDAVLKNFPGLRNELLDKISNLKCNRQSMRERDDVSDNRSTTREKVKDAVLGSMKNDNKYTLQKQQNVPQKDLRDASIARIETIIPKMPTGSAAAPIYQNYNKKRMDHLLKRPNLPEDLNKKNQRKVPPAPSPPTVQKRTSKKSIKPTKSYPGAKREQPNISENNTGISTQAEVLPPAYQPPPNVPSQPEESRPRPLTSPTEPPPPKPAIYSPPTSQGVPRKPSPLMLSWQKPQTSDQIRNTLPRTIIFPGNVTSRPLEQQRFPGLSPPYRYPTAGFPRAFNNSFAALPRQRSSLPTYSQIHLSQLRNTSPQVAPRMLQRPRSLPNTRINTRPQALPITSPVPQAGSSLAQRPPEIRAAPTTQNPKNMNPKDFPSIKKKQQPPKKK